MSDFLLAEGFGNLSDGVHTAGATTEILGEQWTGYEQNFWIVDRGDGRKWLTSGGIVALASKNLGDPSTFSVCFRIYRGDSVACTLVRLNDAAGLIGHITILANGTIGYQIALLGTPYATWTCDNTIPLATETFVELRFVLSDTVGSIAFYLDGVLINTVSGIDNCYSTGRTNLRNVVYGDGQTVNAVFRGGWKYGDFIVHTAAAGIGDPGVFYLPADADGADADFTPSAGANWQCVDEIGPDEDTTYNESDGTAGHRDSFETAGVSGMAVLSVGVLVRARKTDTGVATLLLGAIDGASEDQSAPKGLSAAYQTFLEFFDDAPAGGAWNAAKVTAAEFSYEVGA